MYALISALAAMAVLMIMAPGFLGLNAQSTAQVRAAAAASDMQAWNNAVGQYVNANYNTSTTLFVDGAYEVGTFAAWCGTGANACEVTPATVGLADTFLPPGYIDANPYGQQHVAWINGLGGGNFLTITETTGGAQIDSQLAPGIAAMIGPSGGYVTAGITHTAGLLQGAYGAWQESPVVYADGSPGAGHLAGVIYTTPPPYTAADYLYRQKPLGAGAGQSTLNTMQTDVHMGLPGVVNGQNSIDDAKQLILDDQTNAASWTQQATGGSSGNSVLSLLGPGGQGLSVDQSGNVTSGNFTIVGGAAAPGTACPGGNYLAQNNSGGGGLLECVGGIWTTIGAQLAGPYQGIITTNPGSDYAPCGSITAGANIILSGWIEYEEAFTPQIYVDGTLIQQIAGIDDGAPGNTVIEVGFSLPLSNGETVNFDNCANVQANYWTTG